MESGMKYRKVLCFTVLVVAVLFTPLSSGAQVSGGVSSYQKALHELEVGNPNEALVQIQQALAESPEQLEYQYQLGVIYFQLGRLDESEGIFQVLVHTDETRFRKAWFDLAHIAEKKGKRAEAIDLLQNARSVDPGRADLESGIAYLKLKDYQKAIDLSRKARTERPDLTFQSKLNESAALSQLKKYDESRQLLETLLKLKLKPQEKELVSNLLASLNAAERADKRWHISGLLGFVYDTNLLLNPVAPAGVVPTNESDFAQVSSITGRYDLVRNDPWVFGAAYNHYNLTYFEHGKESVIAARPSLYGYWNSPPFFAGLEYVYGHYWAGDTSRANVNSIYPVFAFASSERWRTEIRGWSDWRQYEDITPDDQLYGAGIIEYYLMKNGLAHFRAGVLHGYDDTSPRNAGSYSDTEVTAGVLWPVWMDKWFLDVSGFYIFRDYRFDPTFSTDMDRRDREKDLYVTLRGPLCDNTQIMFIFQRVWNDSNIDRVIPNGSFDPFSYKRAIFSWMLVFDF